MLKIAIMQPYLFPYLGYFQLINCVDKFLVYDDVNYINKSWINRNRILVKGKEFTFTIPLKKVSQNKLINEIEIVDEGKWKIKLLRTIENNYKNAPFFSSSFPVIKQSLMDKEKKISKFIVNSLKRMMNYLNIDTRIVDSTIYYSTGELKGADRILEICKQEKAYTYINPIGGQNIYSKEYFAENGVNLFFIRTEFKEYNQSSEKFIPNLSIIDLIMNNSIAQINEMLISYELH